MLLQHLSSGLDSAYPFISDIMYCAYHGGLALLFLLRHCFDRTKILVLPFLFLFSGLQPIRGN